MIKSQQDIKNETKAKSEKIPKSMENKLPVENKIPKDVSNDTSNNTVIVQQKPQPNVTDRLATIETYLSKVDLAFAKLSSEIENLKGLIQLIKNLDSEISKLTGDTIRLAKLEEDRYVEIATAINKTSERITIFEESIPNFINISIANYISELNEQFELEEPIQPDTTQEPK